MKINRVKGMYDILPEQSALWQKVEQAAISVLQQYGYCEMRLPILERTELFARAIGTDTDVVSKEMYTFDDRNGDSLTMRPEGTAGSVRAVIAAGLIHNHVNKIWYSGPMFRHENVQRGRNRQFYQIGGEACGLETADVDAEMILLLDRIWSQLGLTGLVLEINSLGDEDSRKRHRGDLVEYFREHMSALDEDSQRRLTTNPLRILDSKNPDLADLIVQAPTLVDYLDQESADHFSQLQSILDTTGVQYTLNPRLVRGLDYYNRTVFEYKTDELGAQGTVCGGGRYDSLIERQGGKATPAVGFSMGVDRLVELMSVQGNAEQQPAPDLFMVISQCSGSLEYGHTVAEQLRDNLPGFSLQVNLGGGGFRAQFRRADKSGARFALVIGEDEIASSQITVKNLRDEASAGQSLPMAELSAFLKANLE